MKKVVVLMLVLAVVVVGGEEGELTVDSSSPFCSDNTSFLTCDFKGTQEVMINTERNDLYMLLDVNDNQISWFVTDLQYPIIFSNTFP